MNPRNIGFLLGTVIMGCIALVWWYSDTPSPQATSGTATTQPQLESNQAQTNAAASALTESNNAAVAETQTTDTVATVAPPPVEVATQTVATSVEADAPPAVPPEADTSEAVTPQAAQSSQETKTQQAEETAQAPETTPSGTIAPAIDATQLTEIAEPDQPTVADPIAELTPTETTTESASALAEPAEQAVEHSAELAAGQTAEQFGDQPASDAKWATFWDHFRYPTIAHNFSKHISDKTSLTTKRVKTEDGHQVLVEITEGQSMEEVARILSEALSVEIELRPYIP